MSGPPPTGSMRTTSAPSCASVSPAVGPATKLAISTTDTPVSTRSPPSPRLWLVAVEELVDHRAGLGMPGRHAERSFEDEHPRQRGHQGEQQVVHRAEVVVDELRLEPGFRRDPARRHGGVARLEHQLQGRLDQRRPGARVLGPEPSRRPLPLRHVHAPALTLLLATIMLCTCTAPLCTRTA